ncbi:general amidase-like protein GmdB [Phaeosphaeriaceae sp. PMI808]|nr:general amidase-like protein GmdB [Phaeosphaeriaceae sp. PMI808]
MATGSKLHVIQPKPIPKGTLEHESKREAILEAFSQKAPPELHLPPELFASPPIDVSSIPNTCGILSPADIDITENYDATSLAEAIATRKLTAVEVATAFCKRAIIAHQLTCCLTQWFMPEAIAQAKELDEYQEKHGGKTMGPLHGVPISIKEHMPIAGTYSSYGYLATRQFDEKDSLMVSILRDMGAVFYCKTNQPQLIMHLESASHHGRTLNPFNTDLTSGGSSGGEGALIGMKGSVLGVGSDIGGSIRTPSAFCGIYGFKPTSAILPMKGFLPRAQPVELNVLGVCGPMCRSLRDMDLFTSIILSARPFLQDSRLVPLPWTGLKTDIKRRVLKVGIISSDGFIDPQPPVKRAIEWASNRLSDPKYSSIVQVKEFKPYNVEESWTKICRMYFPIGTKSSRAELAATGEPIHPLSDWILESAEPHDEVPSGDYLFDLNCQLHEFRSNFLDSWNEQDVDIVIGPAFVGPAPAHDTAFYWTYTSIFNFVDYPAVVVPTPIRAEAQESYAVDYKPLSKACAHVKELWEASNSEGAPVNLQIVARRYQDNELFGALRVLQDIMELP